MRFGLVAAVTLGFVGSAIAACASGSGGGFDDTSGDASPTGHAHTSSTASSASSNAGTGGAAGGGAASTATAGGDGGAGTGGAGSGGAGGAATTASSSASSAASSASSASSSSAASSSSSGGGTSVCGFSHLVISQLKTRGVGGGNDEFLELYNPTSAAIGLSSSWTIEARANDVSTYDTRWIGSSGKSIPAHGHFLIVGTSYQGSLAGDDTLLSGIKDASSVRLKQGSAVVDAICTVWSAGQTYGTGFTCEGAPADNTPHNDDSTAASNVDASLLRGDDGCADTGTSSLDFVKISPSTPRNHTD